MGRIQGAIGQVGEAISGNNRGDDGAVYYSVWAPGDAARTLPLAGEGEGVAATVTTTALQPGVEDRRGPRAA